MDKENYAETSSRARPKQGITAACAVLAIVLFAACLVGAAWAWYSSAVTSGENVLFGAGFDLTVSIDGAQMTANEADRDYGWYSYDGQTDHSVLIKRVEAALGKGYCRIEAIPDHEEGAEETSASYYTPQIESEFSVNIKGAGRIKITPVWGTLPEEAESMPATGAEVTLYVAPPTEDETEDTQPSEQPAPQEQPTEQTTEQSPENGAE